MFEVGDVLKADMNAAEEAFEGAKGTNVYDKMMELARTKRLKVVSVTVNSYTLRHLDEDPPRDSTHDANETHSYFVKDEELTKQHKESDE